MTSLDDLFGLLRAANHPALLKPLNWWDLGGANPPQPLPILQSDILGDLNQSRSTSASNFPRLQSDLSPTYDSGGGILGNYFGRPQGAESATGILAHLTDNSPTYSDASSPPFGQEFDGQLHQLLYPIQNSALGNPEPTPPNSNWPPSPPPRNGATASIDDTSLVSDASPDPWIPNEEYAQAGARRGGARASTREFSPLEQMRWDLYNHNIEILREVDPNNRLLFSLRDENSAPSQREIYTLENEIARALREQGRRGEFENHHNLPREFNKDFLRCGLDPEDFTTYVPRNLHRIRPEGLHTGPTNWNSQWREYFLQSSDDDGLDDVLRKLIDMWEKASWVRR